MTGVQTCALPISAVLTPFIYLALVIGLSVLRHLLTNRFRWRRMAITGLFAAQILGIYWLAPLPGLRYNRDAIKPFQTSPYRQSLAQVKRLVGPDDAVVTTNNVAAHFTQRSYEWAYPYHLDQADDVILLTIGPFDNWDITITQTRQNIASLKKSKSRPRSSWPKKKKSND